jgi:phage major head subunit gpT-like protein
MPISLHSIRDLLTPGLDKVTGKYKEMPSQWAQCGFTKSNSTMAQESRVQVAFLPLAGEKADGGATQIDVNAGQRYRYNQKHKEISLGYVITRQSVEDNLYKSQFNPTNLGLQRSFSQTKETYAANIFNTGTTCDSTVGGDGKALFATDHPIDGSTIANTPSVQADLNESTLLAAQEAIPNNWKDERGLKMPARGKKLVLPVALEKVAVRLLMSELRPGTANNDVNAIRFVAGGLKDYVVNNFLTSDRAWFLITDVDGLSYMERVAFETSMWVDDLTDNLFVKGRERYSFSYYDWRAAYGSLPTN